jgi:uncharacterized integral membrane protein (TIGR00697 family)
VPFPFQNELIFVAHLIVAGVVLLLAGRLGRTWLTALIVVCTVLMNIAVQKQMTIFGLEVTGGNVLFATVFLANDVLNEHFGPRAARQAVMTGFAAGLFTVIMMQFVLWYRPNDHDFAQESMILFFRGEHYGRIVAVSMVSYALSQLLDTQVYHAIRRMTGPKRLLWLRSNGSTWIAQAFDTTFFTTAALVGTFINTWSHWVGAVVFAFVIKIAVAAADTGFLYLTTWAPFVPAGSQRGQRRDATTGSHPSADETGRQTLGG